MVTLTRSGGVSLIRDFQSPLGGDPQTPARLAGSLPNHLGDLLHRSPRQIFASGSLREHLDWFQRAATHLHMGIDLVPEVVTQGKDR